MRQHNFLKYGWLLIVPIFFLASRQPETTQESNGEVNEDCMMGEVKLFAGNFAPRGWALCNGQLLSISANTPLFSLLGTYYGGDGRTTFQLPDLRGRTPVGAGQGPGLSNMQIGYPFGRESISLSTANLPPHSHNATVAINAAVGAGSVNATDNVLISQSRGGTAGDIYTNGVNSTTLRADAASVTIGSTGNGQAFNNRQPGLAMHYIICTTGYYPSRQ